MEHVLVFEDNFELAGSPSNPCLEKTKIERFFLLQTSLRTQDIPGTYPTIYFRLVHGNFLKFKVHRTFLLFWDHKICGPLSFVFLFYMRYVDDIPKIRRRMEHIGFISFHRSSLQDIAMYLRPRSVILLIINETNRQIPFHKLSLIIPNKYTHQFHEYRSPAYPNESGILFPLNIAEYDRSHE